MKTLNNEKISLWQLFLIIVIFELGSAILVGIGNDAKQDAWIAVLLGSLLGVVIISFYYAILSKVPGQNLFGILEYSLGKWIGKILAFAYVLYFFYIAARVLRDFNELIVTTILYHTPMEIISITFMLTVAYMIDKGLEVTGRSAEIFAPYLTLFIGLTAILILLSGELSLDNMRPILGEGFRPVINAVFPGILTFPFGELIVFMVILPSVNRFDKAKGISVVAVLFSGIVLAFETLVEILTLGADGKGRVNFPLLNAAKEISLLNFIERIDILIVFVVMFAILVKVGLFFYGGLKGLEYIFHIPYRTFIFPMAMLIILLATIVSRTFAEHIEEGLRVVPMYLHLPFQFGIPLFLIPFLLWKLKNKKEGEHS